jgi:hypothetical protein
VIRAVTAVLRRAGKVAAGTVPAALVAGLGLPALGTLVFLAVLAAGLACWLFGSDARTDRVSRVLLAWRGDPGRLTASGPAAAPPAPRPRRWPWLPTFDGRSQSTRPGRPRPELSEVTDHYL